MTRRRTLLAIPDAQRSELRATAREIVSAARSRRERGLTDDPAGRVARAMESTYRLGAEDAVRRCSEVGQAYGDETGALRLRLISRLSAGAFTTVALTVFGIGPDGPEVTEAEARGCLRVLTECGEGTRGRRWIVVVHEIAGDRYPWPDWHLSRRVVAPWLAHGLVREDEVRGNLLFTPRALATWAAYLASNPEFVALQSRFSSRPEKE